MRDTLLLILAVIVVALGVLPLGTLWGGLKELRDTWAGKSKEHPPQRFLRFNFELRHNRQMIARHQRQFCLH